MKKEIVVSGINLFSGGTLSVFKDFIKELANCGVNQNANITLFVYKKELFDEYLNLSGFEFIECSSSRKSYFIRLWYEYFYFKKYSKKREIDVWISMHDMTPNVKAKRRYVYCHNSMMFYKCSLKEIFISPKLFLFSKFYKYLYKINIKKNTSVIVQSQWMREEFMKIFHINNVIVARPVFEIDYKAKNKKVNNKYTFFYPSFPRMFKNFEVILNAAKILNQKGLVYEVIITIDGSENSYTKKLKDKYYGIKNVSWIGIQPRARMYELYNQTDSLIFPSKLETWGLPISEYKLSGKPILLVDLPYAKETLGEYDKCAFFAENDAEHLAQLMEKSIAGDLKYEHNSEIILNKPYSNSWKALIELLEI